MASTHEALKKIGEYFANQFNEGGNYVLTRNVQNILTGDISIVVGDALAFIAPTGKLGTIGSAKDPVQGPQGYALLGQPVTAKFSLDLDTAKATLTWTIVNQPQARSTFVLFLYHENPTLGAGASSFYAENASDDAKLNNISSLTLIPR